MNPKQKFLVRLDQDANLDSKVAITLPRIGFEIGSLTYDSTRKLNRVQKFKKVKIFQFKPIRFTVYACAI